MDTQKKVIFISTAGGPMIPRYFLRSGFVAELAKRPDVKVVLIVSKAEEAGYRSEFGGAGADIVAIPRVKTSKYFEMLISLSRSAFHQKLSRAWHRLVERHISRVPLYRIVLHRIIAYTFGTWRPLARIIQRIVRERVSHIPAYKYIIEIFVKNKAAFWGPPFYHEL